MKYRVVYKRYSDMQKTMLLVEEDIAAENITVMDGCLVFVDADGVVIRAIPPALWAGVEPAPSTPLAL